MQRWIRGTAMAALAAATLMGGGLAAQGTPAPTLSVSGVGYAQWNYNLSGTQHNNAFDMTRTYINVTAKFAGGVSTRATSDIYRDPADGSLKYRLKYGFVAYQPNAGNVTYKFGLIQTPWVSREEDLYDYRMQGPIALDRNKIMTSADFGLGADPRVYWVDYFEDYAPNRRMTIRIVADDRLSKAELRAKLLERDVSPNMKIVKVRSEAI